MTNTKERKPNSKSVAVAVRTERSLNELKDDWGELGEGVHVDPALFRVLAEIRAANEKYKRQYGREGVTDITPRSLDAILSQEVAKKLFAKEARKEVNACLTSRELLNVLYEWARHNIGDAGEAKRVMDLIYGPGDLKRRQIFTEVILAAYAKIIGLPKGAYQQVLAKSLNDSMRPGTIGDNYETLKELVQILEAEHGFCTSCAQSLLNEVCATQNFLIER